MADRFMREDPGDLGIKYDVMFSGLGINAFRFFSEGLIKQVDALKKIIRYPEVILILAETPENFKEVGRRIPGY